MSEILKAKNRILNRMKSTNQQTNSQSNQFQQNDYQNFDQPITYPKKFNISSISMKFQRNYNQNNQQHQIKNTHSKSPQFCRTQRINPIRHIQHFNAPTSALSQSNSQSSLRKINSKQKSRRISMQSQLYEIPYELIDRYSEVKLTKQNSQANQLTESPIQKIKKTVHSEPLNLVISKLQKRRCQSPYKPKQCSKQQTQNLINQTQQKSKQFTDSSFPPKLTIIYPVKSKNMQQGISFQRLKNLFQNEDKQIALIHSCEPTMIQQGKFTNPYVYSALTILSQSPQIVLSLIQNQKINKTGIYYIRLCKDGTWRYIIVDDFIPIKNQDNKTQILTTYSMGKYSVCQIWPSLIEKALAKIYGSYLDLYQNKQSGIAPIFRCLTGYPVSKYDLIKDVRSYLVLIDSALKRGHIVILQEVIPQLQYLADSKSISFDYSYQILDIQKNNFIIRNLADLDLVTKLNFEEVMMFSSLLIFRREQNYSYLSQKLRHKHGYYSTVKVNLPYHTSCYWDIWQNNPAYYKGFPYSVSSYKIIIQPLSLNAQNYSSYDSKPEQQIIVESGRQISMKKGQYLLSIHLCQKKQLDFTLSYYGQKQVTIERVKNTGYWHQKCCIQQNYKKNQQQ